MEYFQLGYVKVNEQYKEPVNEVLEEIHKVIDEVNFIGVTPGRGGHSEIWIDEEKSRCIACLDIPDIMNFDDLYLFFHEAGHVVNKHLTTLNIKLNIKEEEVISREREADTYALNKMEKLLSRSIKHCDRKELEIIVKVIKMRINSGYESYKEKKRIRLS